MGQVTLARWPAHVSHNDPHYDVEENPMSTITMSSITTRPCPFCQQSSTLDVTAAQAEAYLSGSLVQDVFPDLDLAQRELLVSGIHPDCWEQNFG